MSDRTTAENPARTAITWARLQLHRVVCWLAVGVCVVAAGVALAKFLVLQPRGA